jgi:GNAT superfamily N-acetyltransferase
MDLFPNRAMAVRMDGTEGLAWFEVAQLHKTLFPFSNLSVVRVADGYAVFPRAGSVHMHALGIGLTTSITERHLEEIESFYWERGVSAQIELCPHVEHSTLELLAQRGYVVTDYTNILFKLLDCSEAAQPAAPAGSNVSVFRAESGDAELWADTVARGFADAEEVIESDKNALVTLFQIPNATCFIAAHEGTIAGGGAVYVNDGVAMLLRSSTLPEHRNRGVHGALLRTRLDYAASKDCNVAMSVAEVDREVTQSNAFNAGFHVAYTRSTLARRIPIRLQDSPT